MLLSIIYSITVQYNSIKNIQWYNFYFSHCLLKLYLNEGKKNKTFIGKHSNENCLLTALVSLVYDVSPTELYVLVTLSITSHFSTCEEELLHSNTVIMLEMFSIYSLTKYIWSFKHDNRRWTLFQKCLSVENYESLHRRMLQKKEWTRRKREREGASTHAQEFLCLLGNKQTRRNEKKKI